MPESKKRTKRKARSTKSNAQTFEKVIAVAKVGLSVISPVLKTLSLNNKKLKKASALVESANAVLNSADNLPQKDKDDLIADLSEHLHMLRQKLPKEEQTRLTETLRQHLSILEDKSE